MAEPSNRGPRPTGPGEARESAGPTGRAASHAVQGTVHEALPNAMFSVELSDGRKVLAHVASTVQSRTVRIVPGDTVTVELSPYDPLRGRITQRQR